MTGKNGKDVYVKVPVGTLVTERYPHEEEFDVGYIFSTFRRTEIISNVLIEK